MEYEKLVGQPLDGKYMIERELGRGGMGTVYLATHVGTERPVAVKIVAPQYMQRPEFVERFRREARAAGRLRHPNVVDVTDFGIAETGDGKVAYLVMEYLDGCTLGEVLDEEKNLPVAWTLDILDQVCSAVHEAHQQGIIHRDLKPDNIWLEPNQRGGYTVKVLDFGIAKVEALPNNPGSDPNVLRGQQPTYAAGHRSTLGDAGDGTIHDSISPTRVFGIGTAAGVAEAQTQISEASTAILPPATDEKAADAVSRDADSVHTKQITEAGAEGSYDSSEAGLPVSLIGSAETRDLTRVGAVLGTPLYMSPEQCRGERLDARSDIYSLGVIAYQMLSGSPPFTGEYTAVMQAHRELPPPPLNVKSVRKKLKRVILSALAKDPGERPQTAEAFATILRSRSEGIFGLLRRAGMIYTEHIAKFLALSMLFHVPMILLTVSILTISLLRAAEQIGQTWATVLLGIVGTFLGLATAFCAYLIIGTTAWIVTQSLAVPLRQIRLRSALREAKRKWKRFAGTGLLSAITQFVVSGVVFGVLTGVLVVVIGLLAGVGSTSVLAALIIAGIFAAFTFFALNVLFTLVGPVLMMENVKGLTAIRRSIELVRRSLVTSIAAVVIMFLVPAFVAGLTSAAVNLSARAFEKGVDSPEEARPAAENGPRQNADDDGGGQPNIGISVGGERGLTLSGVNPDTEKRVRNAVRETLSQLFLLPLQIIMTSFTAIIVALLYLKTRQAGGEPLNDLLAKFEESDQPLKRWQERVRQRLIQSGRVSSNSRP